MEEDLRLRRIREIENAKRKVIQKARKKEVERRNTAEEDHFTTFYSTESLKPRQALAVSLRDTIEWEFSAVKHLNIT